ncbi:MAG: hypothetical protein J0I41_10535 [Filimonas sp.]|nr:hypothetical protein [Filimonas sp.]
MKYYITAAFFAVCFWGGKAFAQVGAVSNTPAAPAVLDLREPVAGSGKKGLLPPQVSLVSITSGSPIAGGTPATGLVVYNTNNALAGGTGYYYWESGKWNKLLNTTDVTGDNLGNHIATQDLNMSGLSIRQAAKTNTQTVQIQQGTDGKAPNTGDVATAADTAGNVVWRPYPDMKGKTRAAFSIYSTAQVSPAATLGSWTAIPGLFDYNYTATATGTLMITAAVNVELDDASTRVEAIMYQSGVRFTAKTGGVALTIPGATVYGYQTLVGSSYTIDSSGKNPNVIVIITRIPVVAGETYNLNLECSDFFRINDTKPTLVGSIISVGGNSYTSYMSGVLIPQNGFNPIGPIL